MKTKFYAIKVGKKTGIYTSWEVCKQYVEGYSGAVYKSFDNEHDALVYLNDSKSINTKFNVDYQIYTDGSYDKKYPEICAYGVVVLKNNKIISTFKGVHKNIYDGNNVSGEILGVLNGLKYLIRKHVSSCVINYDYKGIEDWITSEWKTTTLLAKFYKSKYDELISNSKIKVYFNKIKSHSGNEYNEMADKLAKKALYNN